jgi:peroxiredoxin Q/BCP
MSRSWLLLALALVAWASPIAAAGPEVGSKAPDFSLQGSDGSSVSLAQFLGKRELVLAWFPKAFTPG